MNALYYFLTFKDKHMLRVRFTNKMCIITKVRLHSIVPKMTKGNEILGYATRLTLVIFVC